ncbi:MAG: hypothetical protein MZV63_31300 [Marinilabiliales bacterium]|nr:hypothetical protein [Marinilabiliales bacterium]
MMVFAGAAVSRFINAHPTLQILALSFLILIGFMLVIDGLHYHVPMGYIYFAVFFFADRGDREYADEKSRPAG